MESCRRHLPMDQLSCLRTHHHLGEEIHSPTRKKCLATTASFGSPQILFDGFPLISKRSKRALENSTVKRFPTPAAPAISASRQIGVSMPLTEVLAFGPPMPWIGSGNECALLEWGLLGLPARRCPRPQKNHHEGRVLKWNLVEKQT